MEIGEFHHKVNDPQVTKLLDNILDAVLTLKACLRDSNMDSNSIGGILIFQRSVNQNTAYRYRGTLLRYQLFLGENPPSLAATCEYLGLLLNINRVINQS